MPKKSEPVSLEEMKLIDWYAAFALMGMGQTSLDHKTVAKHVFDLAEQLMKERNERL